MSEVDLSQSPDDFANMANNPAPADPNGQPTGQDPGGATPPADPPAVPAAPPEGAPAAPTEPPAEPKPAVEPPAPTGGEPGQEPKPETPPAPADPDAKPPEGQPEGQPTEPKTPEELAKEQESAAQKISELGEARSEMFKTYLGLVEENPDLIKDIHKNDPKLANQIVKEHWGHESFDDLMAHARVKELEETDPERAELERKVLDATASNKSILKQLKTNAEATFYKDKGILNNEFDTGYKAIQAALTKVSPALIESNYAEALEIAHSIAFPGKTAEQIEADKKKIALATGSSAPIAAPGAGAPPPTPSKHSEAQAGFMQNVGVTPN